MSENDASLQARVGSVRVEAGVGDIARQPDADAVVNAANAELVTGGGVAGALHRAAGPELARLCRPYAPIRPGEAVITPAGRLPNKRVIHCLGPVYGRDEPAGELLAGAYRRAIELAEDNGLASIAFPALSTGAFGYPTAEAAPIAFETVARALKKARSLRLVRFVFFDKSQLEAHRPAFEEVFGADSG